MSFRLKARGLYLLWLVPAMAVPGGCGEDSPTAPPFTAITLTADAATVPANGTVQLTATMTELSGLPVADGTTIVFSCCGGDIALESEDAATGVVALQTSSATLGTIQPAVGSTVGGKVTATFTAGVRSGVARIVASSGTARAGTLNLPVGSVAASRVFLRATPPAVSQSGGTVELVATVVDSASNGVPGIPVAFSTTSGVLSAGVVPTNEAGEARVQLTAQREATVTASVGSVAQPASVTVRIIPAPTISASVSPQSPTVGSPAQFAFAMAPGTGGAALKDLAVNFGDGNQRTITGVSGTTFVAHAFAQPGTYVVTGTVTDVSGERAQATIVVAVQPRPPIIVSIEVPNAANLAVTNPIVFSVSVTPTSELPRVSSYEWDFGDGQTAVVNSHSVSHFYHNPGPRIVRVTVVTTDGARFSAQAAILIRDN